MLVILKTDTNILNLNSELCVTINQKCIRQSKKQRIKNRHKTFIINNIFYSTNLKCKIKTLLQMLKHEKIRDHRRDCVSGGIPWVYCCIVLKTHGRNKSGY